MEMFSFMMINIENSAKLLKKQHIHGSKLQWLQNSADKLQYMRQQPIRNRIVNQF